MDITKISAYAAGIVGNLIGMLVYTAVISDATGQAIGISTQAVLNALAIIFASNSGPKK